MIQRYTPGVKVHMENGVLAANPDHVADPAGPFVLYKDHLVAVTEAASGVIQYSRWGWERTGMGVLTCFLCGSPTNKLPTGPCPCEHDVPMAEQLAEFAGWSFTTWGGYDQQMWVKDGIAVADRPVPVGDIVSIEALQAFLAPRWRIATRCGQDKSWSAVATRHDGLRLDLTGYTNRWRAHAAAVIQAVERDRKEHAAG